MVDDGYVNERQPTSHRKIHPVRRKITLLLQGKKGVERLGGTIINNVLLMALFAFEVVVSQKLSMWMKRHGFGLYGIILELGGMNIRRLGGGWGLFSNITMIILILVWMYYRVHVIAKCI